MSQKLPVDSFEWLTDREIKKVEKNLKNTRMLEDCGCFFEVDLEYTKDLHESHNEYPLCPENIKVDKKDISPYAKDKLERLGGCCGAVKKLLTTLNDKEKCVLHYLSLGMKLVKVHKGLRFHETAWLRSYIEKNTKLRMEAKNDFKLNFFKLLNNSVFGKTMYNLRDGVDVRLVNNITIRNKLISKPNFNGIRIITPTLASIQMKLQKLALNKPTYCGMAILGLSKTFMYDSIIIGSKNKTSQVNNYSQTHFAITRKVT